MSYQWEERGVGTAEKHMAKDQLDVSLMHTNK